VETIEIAIKRNEIAIKRNEICIFSDDYFGSE